MTVETITHEVGCPEPYGGDCDCAVAEVWCQRCPEPATETYNGERLCHEDAVTLAYKIESTSWRR